MELVDIETNVSNYVSALEGNDFERAKNIARELIGKLKLYFENPPIENPDVFLESLFYRCVFLRALYDFAHLLSITSVPNWSQSEMNLEAAWDKLCDCKERFDFAQGRIGGRLVENLSKTLGKIENYYFELFGQGSYVSPELLIKRELCSLCGEDMRICPHMAGRIYSGRLCASIPDSIGIQMKAAAIVQVPHDPRCRIWPWQIKGDIAPGIKILSVFRLDDFTDRDDWG